jgi:hypothetical protein
MSRSKVDTPAKIDAILARIPTLPDSAVVPIAVAAAHDNVCPHTVRRNYPRVQLTRANYGVRVGDLRNRNRKKSSA